MVLLTSIVTLSLIIRPLKSWSQLEIIQGSLKHVVLILLSVVMLTFGIFCLPAHAVRSYSVVTVSQVFLIESIIQLILRTRISVVFQPLCPACFLLFKQINDLI